MEKYKQNRKLISILCDCCGKEFQKPLSEYNRNVLKNRSNYCSRSCSGKSCNKNGKNLGNPKSLPRNPRLDKYSKFRYYYRNAKRRDKNFNLTLEYLEKIWNSQMGKCPYTGINLQLSTYNKNHNNPIYTASLDRIDSNKGYEIGNVQFVSTCINYMKHNMSHEDTLKLCKIIAKHNFIVEMLASESQVHTVINKDR